MKIVQLVTQRQYRGAEIAAAALTEQLTANGQEVVFAGLYKTKGESLIAEGALNIDIAEWSGVKFSPLVLFKLLRFVVQYKPDLIQANGSDTIKYAAVVKMLWPRFKLVYRNISILSVWLGKNRFKQKFYRWLFQQVDHVTSVGYEAANDIGKTLLLPDSKITVIRRSVFSKTVNKNEAAAIIKRKFQWNTEDRILFAAGSFSIEKNFSFLVDVMVQLCTQSKNIRLIIAGKGPELEQIQQQIIEKGLQAFIILPGFEADLSMYYAAADVFVMCSKVEGVPGVILEAGLAATPAIANDTGGVKEVIHHGVTGILLPSLEVNSYAATVLRVINNPVLCAQLGEAARQFVSTEFNPEKNLEAYIHLYQRLVISAVAKTETTTNGLHILQLIQKFQIRGAENFATQLASHLRQQNHHVLLVALAGESKNEQHMLSLNVNLNWRFIDFFGWYRLYRLIKQHHIQVVQANASDTLKYAVMSKLLFRWKSPLVYRNASMMSHYLKGKLSYYFNRFLLRHVHHIVAVSNTSMNDLVQTFNINKQQCTVIPSGIEEQSFKKKTEFVESFFHIAMVAGFTFEKNHKGMLSIFEKVVAMLPHAKLWLIGDGPLRNETEQLVQEKQLQEKVVFTGNVSNPLDYIHSANVLVVPSILEGLPAVILEAFYVHTPVVAYDVGGISEVVQPHTGWLINSADEDAFAQCLVQLSNEQLSVIETKTKNAHKLVQNSYLNTVLADQFETVYKNVLHTAAG